MTERLMAAMIRYDSGDAKRIQHFLKVHALARLIGTEEGLDSDEMVILETAALVHDIGIRLCEKKYGRCSGDLQEKEGPAEARRLLEELGYPPAVIERVVYLVGHHHTYRHIDGRDYQILVEADFLVNLYEDAVSPEGIRRAYDAVSRTESGRRLCREMFMAEG